MAIGAHIKFPLPFSPVPVTLQTLFLYLAAGILEARLSALAALAYIMLGAFGLPAFAGGGGLLYIIGPTGGYLMGFLPAAAIISYLVNSRERQRVSWNFLSMFIGFLVLSATGVTYLWAYYNFVLETPVTISHATAVGLLPFVPGDAAKCLAAALVSARVKRIIMPS